MILLSIGEMKVRSPLFLGIDVGTGSARAGVFTASGKMLGSASHVIRMWKPRTDFVEQSSDDIWRACCLATKEAIAKSEISPELIKGVGFDATCSLVLLDEADRPVAATPGEDAQQNVIVWMDHRSIREADEINKTKHPVLRYVGGVISPEMQTPKLLWLKRNSPAAWKATARFLDLPDFLTYRATGDETRSLCTTVCKWTYLGHRGPDGAGWDASYFQKIGLGDLVEEGYRRIGRQVRPLGESVGRGLTEKAAAELGLIPLTPVGVGIIDAHAGGLGMLGAKTASKGSLESRLALIGGTSSCHMAVSVEPRFLRGIWGPYHSAMVPGWWLMEGGQSATGALIDHIISSHPAATALSREAKAKGQSIYECLNDHLEKLVEKRGLAHPALLTEDFHILPDFHGNRSPRANPTLKGSIVGLTLSEGSDELAIRYLAAVQAVAYGTRHIIEEANKNGYTITEILITGGGTKNPVFLREHADITGCQLLLPAEQEAVLLGASTLGAVASGRFDGVLPAMEAMNKAKSIIRPQGGEVAVFHDLKYKVFLQMHTDFQKYRKMMASR